MLGTQWAPSKWECASFSLGKSSHTISLFSISHSLSGNVLWDRHWPFWVGRSSIFLTFSYFWFISLSFSSTLWKMGLTSILFIQLVWGIFFFFCWVFVFSFCLGLSYVSFPRINFLFSDCFFKNNNLFLIHRYDMFFQLSENFVNGFEMEEGCISSISCHISISLLVLFGLLSPFSSAILGGGCIQISAELLTHSHLKVKQ